MASTVVSTPMRGTAIMVLSTMTAPRMPPIHCQGGVSVTRGSWPRPKKSTARARKCVPTAKEIRLLSSTPTVRLKAALIGDCMAIMQPASSISRIYNIAFFLSAFETICTGAHRHGVDFRVISRKTNPL